MAHKKNALWFRLGQAGWLCSSLRIAGRLLAIANGFHEVSQLQQQIYTVLQQRPKAKHDLKLAIRAKCNKKNFEKKSEIPLSA